MRLPSVFLQLTVSVTVVLWLSDPDVPVTVMVQLLVGMSGFDGALPDEPPSPVGCCRLIDQWVWSRSAARWILPPVIFM